MSIPAFLADPRVQVDISVEIQGDDDGTTRTFYYSRSGFESDSGDTPASTTFEPRLLDLSGLDEVLQVEEQFAGLAEQSRGRIRLRNDDGVLDFWEDLEWVGLTVIVRVGEIGTAHSTWKLLRTGHISAHPIIGQVVELEYGPVLEDLAAATLAHDVHDGIEIAYDRVGGSTITVPSNAVLTPTRGWLATVRVVTDTVVAGATTFKFFRKVSGTLVQWQIGIFPEGAFAGRPWAQFTTAAGAGARTFIGDDSILDGRSHVIGLGILPGVRAYMLLDSDVLDVDEAVGAVDSFDGEILISDTLTVTGEQLIYDARLYHYVPEDDAFDLLTEPPSNTDPLLIEAWKLNENGGSTAAGVQSVQSGTYNDATPAWKASGGGEPDFAGRMHPIWFGLPRNAPGLKVSPIKNVHRWHDGRDGNWVLDVNAKGVQVAASQSTTAGLLANGAALAEPVTGDALNKTTTMGGETDAAAQSVLPALMDRTRFGSAGADVELVKAKADYRMGAVLLEPAMAGDALRSALLSIGGHLREDPAGDLVFDVLSDPLSPSPRGTDCVDFTGGTDSLDFGDVGDLGAADYTIGAWYFPVSLDPSIYDTGGALDIGGGFVHKYNALGGGFVVGLSTSRRGAIAIQHDSGASITSDVTTLRLNTWNWVTVDYRDSDKRVRAYVRTFNRRTRELSAERQVLESTMPSGVSANSRSLLWGGAVNSRLPGSLWRTFAFGRILEPWERAAYALDDRVSQTSDHVFLIEGAEGSGPVEEHVSGNTDALGTGIKWAPDLDIDLSEINDAAWGSRPLAPAGEVVVRYDRNWSPTDPANLVVGSLDDDEIEALRRPYREHAYRGHRGTSPPARAIDLEVDTWLTHLADARALARRLFAVRDRDKIFAELRMDRRGWALQLMDEIRVRGVQGALVGAPSFRVVGIQRDTSGQGSTTLALWGPRLSARFTQVGEGGEGEALLVRDPDGTLSDLETDTGETIVTSGGIGS